MWKPIASAPKDGRQILVKGGTYICENETFPSPYPLCGVALVNWNKSDGNWRGEQTEGYDEFFIHEPTHFIEKDDLLALPEDGPAHDSDCATHNMPAMPNGPCDCSIAATV